MRVFSKYIYLLMMVFFIPTGFAAVPVVPKVLDEIQQKSSVPSMDAPSSKGLDNSLRDVVAKGVLRLGIEMETLPMHWLDESGKSVGFDYELAEQIATYLGVSEVEVVGGKYSELPDMLRNDKADIIMSGYVPDESIEGVDWSDSYLDFGLCLVVKKSSTIKNTKQLKGRRVGIYADDAAEAWVRDNIPNVKITRYEDFGWFENLAGDKRELDAIIYDYPFAIEELKKSVGLKIAMFNLNESHYAIGVKHGNNALLKEVNLAIDKVKDSVFYDNLLKKYLPIEIEKIDRVGKNEKLYIVKSGDTLSGIASQELGDANAWTIIWKLNESRIANPRLIPVGAQLLLPKN